MTKIIQNLSKHMAKIVDFGTHFESIWIYAIPLAPTCKCKSVCVCIPSLIFLQILCANGVPIWDPKITLGASGWTSELPRTSLEGNFLRTYFLHEIWVPKLKKLSFLDRSTWLKHNK